MTSSALSTAVESPARTGRDAGELRSWIEERLRRAARARSETIALSVAAPLADPEALFEIVPAGIGFFWHPPQGAACRGPAVAGVGAAHRIRLAGERRFRQLADAASRVWQGLTAMSHPDCESPPPPRFYGGLAFDVGAADHEPWTEFGDGCFTLPRLLYARDGDSASLTVTLRAEEVFDGDEGTAAALADEIESLRSALAGWHPAPSAAPSVLEMQRPPRSEFAAQVDAIRSAIAGGSFSKIVAAGCSRARLAAALDPGDVLRRLTQGVLTPARSRVTRYAFRRRLSTFLGATPERLIARHGQVIASEALAGSIASGAEHGARLLASDKDLREHQLVIDSIVRRLRPLTDRLEVAERPRIQKLRDVFHLHTPISGVLRQPRHVLELVEELHPTPAVGGVPTGAAMRWIREHEAEPRGWYAAPVGWFDAAGDGEFAVALRSCVLTAAAAGGMEALIYAGAGIVRDSDPDLEYTETELKKQTLLTALGA
ncbi:MAG: isochorismate synthase [Thermoanaerobaculia bacterium]